MNQTRCIITGCQLRLEGSTHAVAGDLFLQGDRFIFNGNWKNGETLWVPKEELGHYTKVLTIPYGIGEDHFERRGLFVMRASRRLLNDAANTYTASEAIPS
jgi:hypothetical protein